MATQKTCVITTAAFFMVLLVLHVTTLLLLFISENVVNKYAMYVKVNYDLPLRQIGVKRDQVPVKHCAI